MKKIFLFLAVFAAFSCRRDPVQLYLDNYADYDCVKGHPLKIIEKSSNKWSDPKIILFKYDENDRCIWRKLAGKWGYEVSYNYSKGCLLSSSSTYNIGEEQYRFVQTFRLYGKDSLVIDEEKFKTVVTPTMEYHYENGVLQSTTHLNKFMMPVSSKGTDGVKGLWEYDDNWNLIHRSRLDTTYPIDYKYEYLEFDKNGNWLKRIEYDLTQPDKDPVTETRTILYSSDLKHPGGVKAEKEMLIGKWSTSTKRGVLWFEFLDDSNGIAYMEGNTSYENFSFTINKGIITLNLIVSPPTRYNTDYWEFIGGELLVKNKQLVLNTNAGETMLFVKRM